MTENQASAARASEASQIKSEKSKDIRQTNIIAAKGKQPPQLCNWHLTNSYFIF